MLYLCFLLFFVQCSFQKKKSKLPVHRKGGTGSLSVKVSNKSEVSIFLKATHREPARTSAAVHVGTATVAAQDP